MSYIKKLLVTWGQVLAALRRRFRRIFYAYTLKSMGRNCQICDGVIIKNPHTVSLGNSVVINEGVILQSRDDSTITIGNNVSLSYGVYVLTGGLDISSGVNQKKHLSSPVVIDDRVWICAKAIILPGVRIGKNSVVAAGAVVDRDVPPGALVAGVPAKIIKMNISQEKCGG